MLEWEKGEFLDSLKDAISLYTEKAHKGMEEVGKQVLETARDNSLSKYDTGEMEENSGYEVQDNLDEITSVIGFKEFYSIYVHQGTGIYAINGDGRQTPWYWNPTTSKWIDIANSGDIATSVDKNGEIWIKTHGQKPSPFLQDALDQLEEDIPTILCEVMNND